MSDDSTALKSELSALRAELVEQERLAGRVEDILRRTVTRLAVLASESSPKLEEPLRQLREVIRDQVNPEQIQPLLTRIEKSAWREEKAAKGIEVAGADAGELLRHLLAELTPPASVAEEIARLKQEAATDDPLALERIAHRLAHTLNRLGDSGVSGSEVCEVLTELLERLALSGPLAERADEIKSQLAEQPTGDRLAKSVRDIGELVARIQLSTTSDQEDLEGFLRQVDEQLRGLMDGLENTSKLQRESKESGRRFHSEMNAEFDAIEAGVNAAASLEEHKRSIIEQMRSLRDRLNQHRHEDDQRSSRAEVALKNLLGRMVTMEKERGRLRDALIKAREAAHRDPLTGLHNRLGYEEFLTQEYRRWKRYKTPLAIVVFDIDHFKRINDSYGHKAGDKVLTAIASRLRKLTREPDFLARYGGEEFVLLMPETDRRAAFTVSEKLREAIAEMGFTYRGDPVKVTVSIGVTEFTGDDTKDTAFQRADQGMYQAKGEGRNQSILI